jgi:hypothetical protein
MAEYQIQELDGIEVLITSVFSQWASRVEVDIDRFLFWKRFDVIADHPHRPTSDPDVN